jgi:hypothetical protein
VDLPYWFTVSPRKCNATGPTVDKQTEITNARRITVECRQRSFFNIISSQKELVGLYSQKEQPDRIMVILSSKQKQSLGVYAIQMVRTTAFRVSGIVVHDSVFGRYHHNLAFTIHTFPPVISYAH